MVDWETGELVDWGTRKSIDQPTNPSTPSSARQGLCLLASLCYTAWQIGNYGVIVLEGRCAIDASAVLTEAEHRLRSLSPERLRVANGFLAYLQEREENQATTELLSILGF